MQVTNTVTDWINILRNRPKMIIAEDAIDYRVLKIYIEGYIDGIGHGIGKNIRKDITEWFQVKINQQSSIYWTDHIPNYYKKKSDDQLKKILLDTTEEYFLENSNWHIIPPPH
ncbi:MAG: hypothetical protein K2Q24_16655 [Chitinophagaceae bacterium]|jgi:hypothetical protein|nr:hypothetical protein [Chitinophagaceae bacterium]